MDPEHDDLDEAAPNDDLDADIAAALKQSGISDTDAADDDVAAAQQTLDDQGDSDSPAPESDEAEPDTEEVAASEDTGDTTEDAEDQDEGEKAEDQQEPPPIEPPARLSEADKDTFRSLPREGQEFLARRHQEMEAEFTRKTMELADQRKTAEAFAEVIEPYKPYIASLGTTPQKVCAVLLATEYALRNGSDEKRHAAFAQLAKDYRIDVSRIFDDMSEDTDPSDPVTRLNERLVGLERRYDDERRQAAVEVNSRADNLVQAFAAETDAEGKLLRPHFDEVRLAMGSLLQANEDMDLQTAYDSAVWGSPKLRADLLTLRDREAVSKLERDKAEAEKKAQAERARKAKEAKRAAATVRSGSQPTGPKADEELSLEDEIKRNWDRAVAS